ncbi:hypothetical protein ACFQUU_06330 [Herbaspirillum sp. GCM10030257]|uniref:hypothetical protein n=1 Tax=Herbaspirillum sp. GCM10030257 TaxID=3273393 RepID=UPI00360DC41A
MTGFTPPPSSTDPDRRNTGPAVHAGAQPRVEPTVDGASDPQGTSQVNPAYEQFQREYAERYARYEQPNVPRRRLPRLAYMAMVFIVGAGVGLGSAWWVGHQSSPRAQSVPGISSSTPLLPPLAEARKLTAPGHGTGVRGISPSELPYDGAPPPDDADDLPAVVPPLASASNQRSSPIANSSGNSVDEMDVQSEPTPRSSTSTSVESAAPSRQEIPTSQVAKPDAPKEKDTLPALASKEETQPEKSDPKPSVAPQKRKPEPKVAKNLEIERIRQQADEELKKKTEAKRRIEEARVAKKSNGSGSNASSGSGNSNTATARSGGEGLLPKVHGTQVMLARCEQASNIFVREQCKWKLCNGMWGRNGCPSYTKPAGNNAY